MRESSFVKNHTILILYVILFMGLIGCESEKDISDPPAQQPSSSALTDLDQSTAQPQKQNPESSPPTPQNAAEPKIKKPYPLSGASYVIKGKRYYLLAGSDDYFEEGQASWYGKRFHGKRTSNGEKYNMHAYTAAHKTLPFNTWVKVTNMKNGSEVMVRINDRGPFDRYGRLIDLSYAAALAIDMVQDGHTQVRVEAIEKANGYVKLPPKGKIK